MGSTSLAHGETAGIEMFLPDNLHGVFNALANSYVYMALAMVFTGVVFGGGRLERAVRWLFLAQVVTALGQAGWSLFGLHEVVLIATGLVWVIGAPIGFVLLAILFRRSDAAPFGNVERPVTGPELTS